GDLAMIQAESLTFRAYRAAGFICELDAANGRIVVLQRGTEPFRAGTQALLYFIERSKTTGADDDWGIAEIRGVSEGGTCSASWGTLEGVDTTTLEVPDFAFPANPAEGPVYLGTPVRSFEVYTYGLFDVEGGPVRARGDAGGPMGPVGGRLGRGAGGYAVGECGGQGNE